MKYGIFKIWDILIILILEICILNKVGSNKDRISLKDITTSFINGSLAMIDHRYQICTSTNFVKNPWLLITMTDMSQSAAVTKFRIVYGENVKDNTHIYASVSFTQHIEDLEDFPYLRPVARTWPKHSLERPQTFCGQYLNELDSKENVIPCQGGETPLGRYGFLVYTNLNAIQISICEVEIYGTLKKNIALDVQDKSRFDPVKNKSGSDPIPANGQIDKSSSCFGHDASSEKAAIYWIMKFGDKKSKPVVMYVKEIVLHSSDADPEPRIGHHKFSITLGFDYLPSQDDWVCAESGLKIEEYGSIYHFKMSKYVYCIGSFLKLLIPRGSILRVCELEVYGDVLDSVKYEIDDISKELQEDATQLLSDGLNIRGSNCASLTDDDKYSKFYIKLKTDASNYFNVYTVIIQNLYAGKTAPTASDNYVDLLVQWYELGTFGNCTRSYYYGTGNTYYSDCHGEIGNKIDLVIVGLSGEIVICEIIVIAKESRVALVVSMADQNVPAPDYIFLPTEEFDSWKKSQSQLELSCRSNIGLNKDNTDYTWYVLNLTIAKEKVKTTYLTSRLSLDVVNTLTQPEISVMCHCEVSKLKDFSLEKVVHLVVINFPKIMSVAKVDGKLNSTVTLTPFTERSYMLQQLKYEWVGTQGAEILSTNISFVPKAAITYHGDIYTLVMRRPKVVNYTLNFVKAMDVRATSTLVNIQGNMVMISGHSTTSKLVLKETNSLPWTFVSSSSSQDPSKPLAFDGWHLRNLRIGSNTYHTFKKGAFGNAEEPDQVFVVNSHYAMGEVIHLDKIYIIPYNILIYHKYDTRNQKAIIKCEIVMNKDVDITFIKVHWFYKGFMLEKWTDNTYTVEAPACEKRGAFTCEGKALVHYKNHETILTFKKSTDFDIHCPGETNLSIQLYVLYGLGLVATLISAMTIIFTYNKYYANRRRQIAPKDYIMSSDMN